MSNNLSQGAYAPLPQSMSDSDSDKETPLKPRPKFVPSSGEDSLLQNGHSQPPRAAALPEVKKVTPVMSTKRRVCFVLSILACFFTIIIFLWVLPCSESGTCPLKISNWENQHEGIELAGKINVVKSAFRNVLNLAVLYRRDIRFADSLSGVISFLGSNGIVAWYINHSVPPAELNCTLIDVNDDGIYDCLIVSRIGLEAIDPISGLSFWHAHNHTQGRLIAGLDFPIILQDLNRDNVKEILATYNYNGSCEIVIISGRTGTLMGEISVKNCDDIHIVESNSTCFLYLRYYKHAVYYHQVIISELIAMIFDRLEVLDLPLYNDLPRIEFGYLLEDHRLMINNVGSCPLNNRLGCMVKISLTDEKSKRKLFSWSYPNAYSFNPAVFSFKRTRTNLNDLKGHVNGFIVKLWQWNSDTKIAKRSVLVNNNNKTGSVKTTTIIERILLITFNSTNFHVVNASLTNITQLCVQAHSNDFSNCQPHAENQMYSLLISDLDMDGSQEFISYSSTFVNHDESSNDWQLVSTVKVIRLEAEIPKFFEISKNVM